MSLTTSQLANLAGDKAQLVTGECGSVPHEAESVTPSLRGGRDLEQMARRRYQAPTPRREGNFWWLFYRQDEFVDGKLNRKFKRVKPVCLDKRGRPQFRDLLFHRGEPYFFAFDLLMYDGRVPSGGFRYSSRPS